MGHIRLLRVLVKNGRDWMTAAKNVGREGSGST